MVHIGIINLFGFVGVVFLFLNKPLLLFLEIFYSKMNIELDDILEFVCQTRSFLGDLIIIYRLFFVIVLLVVDFI